jgi:hypothetical protein
MKTRKFIRDYWLDVIAFVVVGIIFIVPFLFILLMAAKTRHDDGRREGLNDSDLQLNCIVQVVRLSPASANAGMWNVAKSLFRKRSNDKNIFCTASSGTPS